MPNYLVITKWDGDERVSKSMSFASEADADNFLFDNAASFPAAFIVKDPPGQAGYLIADSKRKTVSFDTAREKADIQARKWKRIRGQRDQLLVVSDSTQLADSPVNKVTWATYRQELRDLPASTTNPDAIVFPAEPRS